jgi:hypothetical protein
MPNLSKSIEAGLPVHPQKLLGLYTEHLLCHFLDILKINWIDFSEYYDQNSWTETAYSLRPQIFVVIQKCLQIFVIIQK